MEPLERAELAELEDLWLRYDETLSFVPTSLYTMARRPHIVRALSDLITVVWRTGTLPSDLKPLIALVSSTAAGCRYCQAHEAVDARSGALPRRRSRPSGSSRRATSTRRPSAPRCASRVTRRSSRTP